MNIAEKLTLIAENDAEAVALKEQLKQRVYGGAVDDKSLYDEFEE